MAACFLYSFSPAAAGSHGVLALLAVLTTSIAACSETAAPEREQGDAKSLTAAAANCVRQAAVEFGVLPLGATVNAAVLPASKERADMCFTSSELEPSGCEFLGRDGVRYQVYDGSISDKVLPLTTRTTARPPLGITRTTDIAEAGTLIVQAGGTPQPYRTDKGKGLSVSLCPAPDTLRSFSVEFDRRGYADRVELQALVW